MIHGLALQLGGGLKLASVPTQGTTAELWIPESDDFELSSTLSEEQPTNDASGPKRILLVDDDFLIAMSSVDMLMDLGHEVVEAHSGIEALEILQKDSRFDLIITDYSMPGMTGGELVVAARALMPDVPILIASGYAELPSGVELDVGRLGKPYTQQQLVLEMAKVLAAR